MTIASANGVGTCMYADRQRVNSGSLRSVFAHFSGIPTDTVTKMTLYESLQPQLLDGSLGCSQWNEPDYSVFAHLSDIPADTAVKIALYDSLWPQYRAILRRYFARNENDSSALAHPTVISMDTSTDLEMFNPLLPQSLNNSLERNTWKKNTFKVISLRHLYICKEIHIS